MHDVKLFAVEEVNRLIPELRHALDQLRCLQNDLSKKEAEIDALELITQESEASEDLNNAIQSYHETAHVFYNLVDELTKKGCHLRNVDVGLVDFYGLYQGKLVFLCWEIKEDKISHWHEVGRGYDSRKPLMLD